MIKNKNASPYADGDDPGSLPKVIIKAENPEDEIYERDAEQVHIIGRVVRTARRL